MLNTYTSLALVSLDYASHLRTCHYWYLVRESSFAHTAFHSRAGLERWLTERGLSLTVPLPRIGTHSTQPLQGSYHNEMHLDRRDSVARYLPDARAPHTMAEWEALLASTILFTRSMSNGRYTEARITADNEGIRTVHILNPNVHERREFDHQESVRLVDPYNYCYHISFHGCKKDSGHVFRRSDERIASDPKAAILALHDEYEQISDEKASRM